MHNQTKVFKVFKVFKLCRRLWKYQE